MKKIIFTLACSLLLITPLSHAYNSYYPQQGNVQQDPVQYIQSALNKMEKFTLNADKSDPTIIRSFLEAEIIPHFSFDEMSYWITGPFAQHMNKTDKAQFQTKLKTAFLNSLTRHLGSFNAIKDRVRFFPTRYRGYNDAVISARVFRANNYPVKLDFQMRRTGSDWKIIDISANGTSAIVYYRQHFMNDLRQYRR